jgi:uncharacterized protein
MRRIALAAMLTLLASPVAAHIQDEITACQRKGMLQVQPSTGYQFYCRGLASAAGAGVPKSMEQAAQWFRKAADLNYPDAQALLGVQYAQGLGVRQDLAEAARLYRKAAEGGHAGAMNNLGQLYREGKGVPRDEAEGMRWIKKAADAGDATAQNNLTAMAQPQQRPAQQLPANDVFEQGKALYKAGKIKESVPFFQRAAEQGNHWAQLQIGYQHEFGEGLPANPSAAATWYAKSAQQGNWVAQKNLGELYENAKGVPENWATALQLYRASAAQGYLGGEYAVGRMYQFGMAVPQNRNEAIAWFKRAAARGDAKADFWVRWLSNPTNNIGFRNEDEQAIVVAGKLRMVLMGEPRGMTFANAQQRIQYLRGVARQMDYEEAMLMWNIRSDEYKTCRNSGQSYCGVDPGPPPSR